MATHRSTDRRRCPWGVALVLLGPLPALLIAGAWCLSAHGQAGGAHGPLPAPCAPPPSWTPPATLAAPAANLPPEPRRTLPGDKGGPFDPAAKDPKIDLFLPVLPETLAQGHPDVIVETPDGNQVELWMDDTLAVRYRDGSVKRKLPDNTWVEEKFEGVAGVATVGGLLCERRRDKDSAAGVIRLTWPDRPNLFLDMRADGRKTWAFPDGSAAELFPDLSQREIRPDGAASEKRLLVHKGFTPDEDADISRIDLWDQEWPDGTKAVRRLSASIVRAPNGTLVESRRNGARIIVRPGGTGYAISPDGAIRSHLQATPTTLAGADKVYLGKWDGPIFVVLRDGTQVITHANGAVTWLHPVEDKAVTEAASKIAPPPETAKPPEVPEPQIAQLPLETVAPKPPEAVEKREEAPVIVMQERKDIPPVPTPAPDTPAPQPKPETPIKEIAVEVTPAPTPPAKTVEAKEVRVEPEPSVFESARRVRERLIAYGVSLLAGFWTFVIVAQSLSRKAGVKVDIEAIRRKTQV